MSSAIARNIFRMFSACCCSWVWVLNFDSFVTPSTRWATSGPKRSSMSRDRVLGVLGDVVEQRRGDRDRVEAELGEDLRRGDGVGDVRLARGALLLARGLRPRGRTRRRPGPGRPAGGGRGSRPGAAAGASRRRWSRAWRRPLERGRGRWSSGRRRCVADRAWAGSPASRPCPLSAAGRRARRARRAGRRRDARRRSGGRSGSGGSGARGGHPSQCSPRASTLRPPRRAARARRSVSRGAWPRRCRPRAPAGRRRRGPLEGPSSVALGSRIDEVRRDRVRQRQAQRAALVDQQRAGHREAADRDGHDVGRLDPDVRRRLPERGRHAVRGERLARPRRRSTRPPRAWSCRPRGGSPGSRWAFRSTTWTRRRGSPSRDAAVARSEVDALEHAGRPCRRRGRRWSRRVALIGTRSAFEADERQRGSSCSSVTPVSRAWKPAVARLAVTTPSSARGSANTTSAAMTTAPRTSVNRQPRIRYPVRLEIAQRPRDARARPPPRPTARGPSA